jgi:hypothetical protein
LHEAEPHLHAIEAVADAFDLMPLGSDTMPRMSPAAGACPMAASVVEKV